jgi:hypothetical protein
VYGVKSALSLVLIFPTDAVNGYFIKSVINESKGFMNNVDGMIS